MQKTRAFDEERLTAYFKEKLALFDLSEFKGLVLGCTHFIYFRKYLERILPPHIKIYDGNEGTIRHLKEYLPAYEEEHLRRCPKVRFYYSGKKCESLELLEAYKKLV